MSHVVIPGNNFIDTCIVYSRGCQKLVHTNVELIDNEKLAVSLLMFRQYIASGQTHSMGFALDIEEESEDDRWHDTPKEFSNMILSLAVGIIVGILFVPEINLVLESPTSAIPSQCLNTTTLMPMGGQKMSCLNRNEIVAISGAVRFNNGDS